MSISSALRRHGLVKTTQLAVYRLAQRIMVLDVTHLVILDANDALSPAVHDDLEFDFLTKDEVGALSQDGTNGLEASLADRMSSRGDLCFAARANNRLAGYVWIAFDQVDAESNRGASLLTGVGVSFPASICFMYKGFVHREFRGRQIYGRLMSRALTALAGRKITHMLSTAEWTNFSALKSCYRIGFRYLGLIWRFGYSWRMCTVTPKSARAMGIRFASRACDAGRSSIVS
jgi:GNAT superfamily N-acetyltransferase